MQTYEQMIRDRRLNATDLRVGWRIIDRMGDSNISWPSHQRIAGELGCARQTVQRSTARLEAFGYLLIVPGGGRGRSHCYGLSGDNDRDDGQFQEMARSEESVRGLTQNCPRPSALSVRGDGHESPHEPSKEPPQGSAPIGAGGQTPAGGLQEEGRRFQVRQYEDSVFPYLNVMKARGFTPELAFFLLLNDRGMAAA